jgi:hypothetical protein
MHPHLLTYYRSGSHFFEGALYEKIGYRINRSHAIADVVDENKIKIKKIITIIRDPRDTLRSTLSLQAQRGIPITHHWTNFEVSNYAMTYDFLFNYADHVIDFNDLINHTDVVIDKTLKFLNIETKHDANFSIEEYNKLVSPKYTPSSKDILGYNDIDLEPFNLGLCYYEYNRLLERKISVEDISS